MKKNWLSHLGAALLTLALLICPFTGSTAAADTTVDADGDGVIRVLGIGSSFGVDGITNLYAAYQAQTGKDNLVLGNLYHGGCTLAQHVKASQSGEAFYDYYTIDKNNADMQWSVSAGESGSYGSTLDEGLLAQNWDVIVVQQGAANAGVLDSYNDDMDTLFSYIRSKDNCKDAKLYWHMTWAFPPTYAVERTGDPLVQNYQGSTAVMYEYILRCMQEKVYPYVQAGTLTDIIPSGIAIENARTSYLEHSLHRDIQHLNALGRTISGYCYYAMLFNGGNALDSIALEVAPADTRSDCKCAAVPMSQLDRQVVLESVNNALTANAARSYTPEASVTPSAYPQPCGGSHTTALTADNLETALAAGGQLYLTDDVSAAVSGPITLTADTTLCLNGHTLRFTGGLADSKRGSAYVVVGAGVTLNICDCTAAGEGVISGVGPGWSLLYANKGVINLHSGSISDASGLAYAAVDLYSGSTLNMSGGKISNNSATRTGGVYAEDGTACTVNLYAGEISGNTGGTFGGGIYGGANAKINLCGGSIHTNTAELGGGVYLKGATLRLVRGNISGNQATSTAAGTGGGGIYMTTYSTSTKQILSQVNLYHGTVGGTSITKASQVSATSGNYAATSGGGICGTGCVSMYQADAAIVGNCSAKFGGGVYLGAEAELTMHNGSISSNRTAQGGGVAVYNANAQFTMEGGELSGNVGTANGGAVRVVQGRAVINDGIISGNNGKYGAVVCLGNKGGAFTLNGGTVTGNTSAGNSSYLPCAVYTSQGSSFTMNGGSIVNNDGINGILVDTSNAVGGTAIINAGTLTGNNADLMLMGDAPKATVYGGTVGTWDANDAAKALSGCLTLYGGSFAQDPTASDKAGWTSTAGLSVTRDGDCWTLFHDYAKAHTDSNHVGWVDLAAQIEGGDYALKDGVRYYLSKSVTTAQSFTVTGKVLICLNGMTLTTTKADVFPLNAAGDMVYLEDCGEHAGTIYGSGKAKCFYVTVDGAAAWMRNGIITGFHNSTVGAAVRISKGDFHMQGGSITGNTTDGDGTTTSHGIIYMAGTGSFTMTGGTISNQNTFGNIYIGKDAAVSISGGMIADKITTSAAAVVTGGQFATEPKEAWIADGCKVIGTGSTDLPYRVVRNLSLAGVDVNSESSLSAIIKIEDLTASELDDYKAVITKAYHYGDADKNAAATQAGKVEGRLDQLAVQDATLSYALTFPNISAKEMGDAITVEFYTADGLSVSTHTFTLADQLMALVEKEGVDAYTLALCTDALHYGAAAQERFGYDTENLVNDGMTQTSTTEVPEWTNGLSVSDGHEALYAATASLKEKLELNLYFNVDYDSVTSITVTDTDGSAIGYTAHKVVSKDGQSAILRVSVDSLAVKDAKTRVHCTVTAGEDIMEVVDSLEGYVARSTSQRDRTVLDALKRYVESAIALAKQVG